MPCKNPKPKFQLHELQEPGILYLSFKAKVCSPPLFAPFMQFGVHEPIIICVSLIFALGFLFILYINLTWNFHVSLSLYFSWLLLVNVQYLDRFICIFSLPYYFCSVL